MNQLFLSSVVEFSVVVLGSFRRVPQRKRRTSRARSCLEKTNHAGTLAAIAADRIRELVGGMTVLLPQRGAAFSVRLGYLIGELPILDNCGAYCHPVRRTGL